MHAHLEDLPPGKGHQSRLGAARLVDLVAAGDVDRDAPGVAGGREVGGQGGRIEQGLGIGLGAPGEAHDHVAPGAVGGVQPQVAAPGVAEGQVVVVPRAASDADLRAVGRREGPVGEARRGRLALPRIARRLGRVEQAALDGALGEIVEALAPGSALGRARASAELLELGDARARQAQLALDARARALELAVALEVALEVRLGRAPLVESDAPRRRALGEPVGELDRLHAAAHARQVGLQELAVLAHALEVGAGGGALLQAGHQRARALEATLGALRQVACGALLAQPLGLRAEVGLHQPGEGSAPGPGAGRRRAGRREHLGQRRAGLARGTGAAAGRRPRASRREARLGPAPGRDRHEQGEHALARVAEHEVRLPPGELEHQAARAGGGGELEAHQPIAADRRDAAQARADQRLLHRLEERPLGTAVARQATQHDVQPRRVGVRRQPHAQHAPRGLRRRRAAGSLEDEQQVARRQARDLAQGAAQGERADLRRQLADVPRAESLQESSSATL